MTVNGALSASGGNGGYRSGGGSGGSIWVRAAAISGDGTIRAHGGNGPSAERAGGGGGGRILLGYGWLPRLIERPERGHADLNPAVLPETLDFTGEVTVEGGSGATDRDGDPGSRLFLYMPPPDGTLLMIR